MKIHDVMRQEQATLLGESLFKSPIGGATSMPYSAVTDPDVLVRTPSFLRSVHPVRLEALSGRDRSVAFVQLCPTLHYKFLWVHADNDRYRDDYRAFLKQFHQVVEELPANLHADHLYNRERAKLLQTPFIRMVLVPSAVNCSHGSGYERSRTRNGVGTVGRDHTMDDVLLMKLCGIPSPKKGQPLTAQMIAHVHLVAATYGMEAGEIERSIAALMEVAAFQPST